LVFGTGSGLGDGVKAAFGWGLSVVVELGEKSDMLVGFSAVDGKFEFLYGVILFVELGREWLDS
jgi:hypothetical protein